jgi:DNA replication initiation complex subunit (GINS family)
MAETTLEFVKRHLNSEMQSEGLHQLPDDFYSRVSQYSRKLRRSAGSENSEAAIRLIFRQTEMIESMTCQLLETRARKATAVKVFHQLLPEEKYVCSVQQEFLRRSRALIEALSAGRPSFIEFARRIEAARSTPVRFVKQIRELVGADLKRYGPFEKDDVASIPSANADILLASGSAVGIYVREES